MQYKHFKKLFKDGEGFTRWDITKGFCEDCGTSNCFDVFVEHIRKNNIKINIEEYKLLYRDLLRETKLPK